MDHIKRILENTSKQSPYIIVKTKKEADRDNSVFKVKEFETVDDRKGLGKHMSELNRKEISLLFDKAKTPYDALKELALHSPNILAENRYKSITLYLDK